MVQFGTIWCRRNSIGIEKDMNYGQGFSFSFSIADYSVILLYFVAIIFIGFKYSKAQRGVSDTKEDFLLAGRKLTLPIFVSTLVATWYGNILGVGEFIFNDGLVGWVCFSLTYYVSAFLFAIFISHKIRDLNISTIPEQIESKYGKTAALISSFIVLIITIPAVYVLILGVIVQMFTGWDLSVSIIISTAISFAYIIKGGFKADVATNTAQFILMYLGFAVLLFFCISEYGSPIAMLGRLPESHLTFTGNYGIQFVIVWFIIAFQTFVDPGFHQRCAAVTKPSVARNGILVSILFWMLFDFMTMTTALYAKAFMPITTTGIMSYPVLSNTVLPTFWKGIYVVSVLAAVMSTLDSYAFISGATIGNDILKQTKKFSHIESKLLTKYGIVIAGIISIIMAISLPSAVDLIYKTASIALPGLFYPLVITYFKKFRLSPNNALIIMLSATTVSLVWTVMKWQNIHINFFISEIFINIEPMIPGILLSLLLGIMFTKRVKL